jgi:hypothetical protein
VPADSDDALMAQVGGGDATAFTVLVERHLDAIHRYLQRLTGAAASLCQTRMSCPTQALDRRRPMPHGRLRCAWRRP